MSNSQNSAVTPIWKKPSSWLIASIVAILAFSIIGDIISNLSSTTAESEGSASIDWFYWVPLAFTIMVVLSGGWHVAKEPPGISKTIFRVVAAVMITASAMWTVFGYLEGNAFDPNTGDPLRMYNPQTMKLDKNFTPTQCREEGASHRGYDYSQFDGCYSAKNGVKLMPVTQDVVSLYIPSTWAGYIISLVTGSLEADVDASSEESDDIPSWLLYGLAALVAYWLLAPSGKNKNGSGIQLDSGTWAIVLGFIAAIILVGGLAFMVVSEVGYGVGILEEPVYRVEQSKSVDGLRCTTQSELDFELDERGTIVVLCPGRSLKLKTKLNHVVELTGITQDFLARHREVLLGREKAQGFYREIVTGLNHGRMRVTFIPNDSAFTRAGLDAIEIHVRGVPR